MGSIIECTKRTYRIQTPNGIKMEVESEERPLNGHTTAKLLQSDAEINSFFEKCKILNVNIAPKGDIVERTYKKSEEKSKSGHKKKKSYRKRKEEPVRIKKVRPEIRGPVKELKTEERLTPFERLNTLLKMEGEFTRLDYQRYMEGSGHKMSNFMGHEDIETALLLKRIESTGEKVGKGLRKYRIVDMNPVDKDTYIQALKEYKMKMKY